MLPAFHDIIFLNTPTFIKLQLIQFFLIPLDELLLMLCFSSVLNSHKKYAHLALVGVTYHIRYGNKMSQCLGKTL